MNSKVYKCCGVPLCKNTSKTTPDKLFMYVPHNKTIRNQWLKLARRDLKAVLPSSRLYFCEDHFDLPNDMENYTEYRVMGKVSQIRLKKGCLPRKFLCQTDRKRRTEDTKTRPLILKRRRLEAIAECERELEQTCSSKSISLADVQPDPSSDMHQPVLSPLTTDKTNVVSLSHKIKTTKTTTKPRNITLSPTINLNTSISTSPLKLKINRMAMSSTYGDVETSKKLSFGAEDDQCDSNVSSLFTPAVISPSSSSSFISQQEKTQPTNNKLQTCPSCYAVLPDAFLSTQFRDNQVRSVIAKVYHYLEQEYEELKCLYPHVELSPLGCVSRRAALATGVTELTVLEVLKEEADRLAAADQPPVIRSTIEGLSDAADCNSEVQEIKQELQEPEVYVAALPTLEPNPLMDFDEANIVVKKEQEDITCYPYSKTAADNVSSDDVVRRDKRRAAAELAGQSSTHPLKDCDEATIIVKKEEEDITLNGDRLILTEVKQEDTDDEGIS